MPTNHKRHGPPRVANGPAPSDAPAPSESSTLEQPKTGPQPQPQPPAQSPPRRPGEGLNITDLKDMSIQKLTQIAKDLNVGGSTGMRKQELIFQILKAQPEQSGF